MEKFTSNSYKTIEYLWLIAHLRKDYREFMKYILENYKSYSELMALACYYNKDYDKTQAFYDKDLAHEFYYLAKMIKKGGEN